MLQLSLLLTLVYVPRVVMTTLTGRVGDWLCVPVAGVAAVLNVYLANYPHSLTACWVALSATCASVNPPAFRSFVHARFSRQGTWQMQRALRIFTLADTLGYACAPFIGGVLYDNGGLRACATFAACTCSACALLPLVLRECRESLASARLSCSSVPSTLSSAGGVPPADVPPNSIHPPNGVTLAYLGPPVTAVMCAAFANICVYAVEWCLYALYFRLKYGWSGAWCGFAQMIGDLLGATVLAISTTRCGAAVGGRFELPPLVRTLVRTPFSVAALLVCHAILLCMLAQPEFAVALTGQILMGTAYVFGEQGVQELLLLYSHGDHAVYRRLVFVHYLVFTAGCALCSPLAYGLYTAAGFASAFYVSAGVALVASATTVAFFACRLARTVGVFGALGDAEVQLLKERGHHAGVRGRTAYVSSVTNATSSTATSSDNC